MDQTTCHVYIESQRNLAKNTNTICLFCFGKNILDLIGMTENGASWELPAKNEAIESAIF